MRRRGPRPVGLALDAVTGELAPATVLAMIQRVWPEVVGEQIARVSVPYWERAGEVSVACESAVWSHQIDLMSERIVEGLNEALGRPAVRRLRPRPDADRLATAR